MVKVGFIDYFLDEWHANNYPAWIAQRLDGKYKVCYAYGVIDSPRPGGLTNKAWSKKYGIELCCGVIIGMGETIEQRVEMAMELAEIDPESIPVNILTPIPNTPFESYIDKIDEENVLRTLAIFKIACPNSSIRLAGGKKARLSPENIEKAFKYCIDSTIVGNYLTTTGFTPQDDAKMIKKIGRMLVK